MPVPLIQEETGDLWNTSAGDYLPTSTWESAKAAGNLAADKTSIGIVGDIYLKNKFDDMALQKTLSVQELNEKYMGSGITWTSPQKEITAELIAKQHERERMWANRASQGSGLLNFGVGLLVGAGDPTMVAGGMAMSAALRGGSLLRGGALYARTAEGAFVSEGLGASVARGAVEGAVTMAPIEAADAYRQRLYQNDVSMTESLINIAHGAAFGATLHGLTWGGKKLYERGAKYFGKEADVVTTELAANQMAEGKRPMVEPVLEHLRREREGLPPGNYERPDGGYWSVPEPKGPVDTSQPVTKEYFLGSQSQAEQLHAVLADTRNASTDFGLGLYGSDNLTAENGFASSDMHGSPGFIHRFETQEAKLFDVEKPLDQGTAALLAGEIHPFEKDVAKALREGEITLRQAYDTLPNEGKAALNQKLSELGYDGLHYTEGERGAQRNGVMLFPDKAENVRVTGEPFQGDPAAKGGLSPSENQAAMEAYAAPENEMFHSREEAEAVDATHREVDEYDADDHEQVDEAHAEALKMAKVLEGKGMLTEEQKAVVQEIAGKSNEGEGPSLKDLKKQGEGMVKEMTACVVEH